MNLQEVGLIEFKENVQFGTRVSFLFEEGGQMTFGFLFHGLIFFSVADHCFTIPAQNVLWV